MIFLLLIPAIALAASVHFISGPTVTANNGVLTVCGKLAGLGNQDVTIRVSALATTTCTNNGSNTPPGQTETLSGSVSNLRVENGTVTFCVSTNRASNPCPDGMKPTTSFSNVELTVIQGGRVVYRTTLNP